MIVDAGGIKLDVSATEEFLAPAARNELQTQITAASNELYERSGPGSDFVGWLELPEQVNQDQLSAYAESRARAASDSEVYVVIGIGGSYLGARSVLEALGGRAEGCPEILFAGTGLCSVALDKVLRRIGDRDFRLCAISKSGTTLEPAVAFRILRRLLIERYGPVEGARRITAVTDASRGALRTLAEQEGYETYVIPDDVGGRFSVLTPVGLLPLAVAGVDVAGLINGARTMMDVCRQDDMSVNPAHLYAAVRSGLYKMGYSTEVMSTFNSGLQQIQEWWKQLFGESEGKGGKGVFPASTVFTTDLHSLGQYVQDGKRNLQETFLCVRRAVADLKVPGEGEGGANLDGLDYLTGRSLDEINWLAYEGTKTAHISGGVPCTSIEIEALTPEAVGGLIYMFEKAVGVSGRLLGVNPFDQPGVETYKKEMFRLLGKPE
jgi:glucose-6-phosphate isomerase